MDKTAAQEILRRFRPGTSDEADPEVREALALAARDRELGEWLKHQLALGAVVRAAVRTSAVPTDLRKVLLEAEFARRRAKFRQVDLVRYALAASVVFLATLLLFQFMAPARDDFQSYRDRMVRTARRNYRMDMLSGDVAEIRSHLAKSHAYEDFALPIGLQRLSGVGCAILHWHDHPVSLICLETPEHNILYLFVTARAHLSGEPNVTVPTIETVSTLPTASWSEGDKTYVLASLDSSVVKRVF
jgi:hypothetical protein